MDRICKREMGRRINFLLKPHGRSPLLMQSVQRSNNFIFNRSGGFVPNCMRQCGIHLQASKAVLSFAELKCFARVVEFCTFERKVKEHALLCCFRLKRLRCVHGVIIDVCIKTCTNLNSEALCLCLY